MEKFDGLTFELSTSSFDVSVGRGHRVNNRSKMDTVGHCGGDDCYGAGGIVSRATNERNLEWIS